MDKAININAIAWQEGQGWVIQGIEYDIVAHASDVASLPDAFMRAVVENVAITIHLGREPLQGVGPAPDRFRTMFDSARTTVQSVVEPAPVDHLPAPRLNIRVAEHA
jgi:hypothetical protein